MSRVDLIGLIALASAYVLGALQARAEQAHAYALLLLMIGIYGFAIWLLTRPAITLYQRLAMYLSWRVARAWALVATLRAREQAQRGADNRHRDKTIQRLQATIELRTKERDEWQKGAEYWEYQARKHGYQDKG